MPFRFEYCHVYEMQIAFSISFFFGFVIFIFSLNKMKRTKNKTDAIFFSIEIQQLLCSHTQCVNKKHCTVLVETSKSRF